MTTQSEVSKAAQALGRLGGKARALVLTPERRREIAVAAGRASGEARRQTATTISQEIVTGFLARE